MKELCISSDKRILIVAPHPDDESIGAGGLLSRFHNQCDVLVLTDGGRGNTCVCYEQEASIRKRQFERAMDIVKPNNYIWLGLRDGELSQYSDYKENIDWNTYDIFIVSSQDDNHADHAAANRYVIKKLRERLDRSFRVYRYEVHLPFHNPTHFLDITSEIETKICLMRCHEDQIKQTDYTQITSQLNKYWACKNKMYDCFYEVYVSVDVDIAEEDTGLAEHEKTLQEIYNQNRLYKSWIECLTNDDNSFNMALNGKAIYETDIYGFGPLGKSVYDYLLLNGINVPNVFDRKKIEYRQICSINLDEAKVTSENIIVTVLKEDKGIEDKLRQAGYKNVMWMSHIL